MEEVHQVLEEELPNESEETKHSLSMKLITRQYHKQVVHKQSENLEKADNIILHQQQRIVALQKELLALQEKTKCNKKSINQRPATAIHGVEGDILGVKNDINREVQNRNELEEKYKKAQARIEELKEQLGLPPGSDHDQIIQALKDLKHDNKEFQNSLMKEILKSQQYQEELRESQRRIYLLELDLAYKKEILDSLNVRVPALEDMELPPSPNPHEIRCALCARNDVPSDHLHCDTE